MPSTAATLQSEVLALKRKRKREAAKAAIPQPYYVAAPKSLSLHVPARVVKTTKQAIGASSTTGSKGAKGSHLHATPYRSEWGDVAIPSDIKPFFQRHVMGSAFNEADNAELRKAFIHADVVLHDTANRALPKLMTEATLQYSRLYQEVLERLTQHQRE